MDDATTEIHELEHPNHGGGRIVVGVDGSPAALAALRRADQLAALLGCTVVALTAWQYPQSWPGYNISGWSPEEDAKSIAQQAADEVYGAQPPARFSSVVRRGAAARALLAESEGAEMLVVGNRGLGGFAGLLLGSVSSACVEHASCPVLVMRQGNDSKRS
ncbi:universal stress protein [Leifsonia sp. NCR5]|uniref:universal stress protein n=1 Tax=Leifsonia sp. NCR5 TaxID=1978342 RepID=UPI000A1980A7|nr:universal stress protein [Leifsonia sp. NCR5]